MKASFGHSASLLFSNVFAKIIGIFIIAYLARVATKEELAIIPMYTMLGELVITGLSFGVFPILTRNLPALLKSDKKSAKSFFVAGGSIIFCGAIISSLLVWLLADRLSVLIFDSTENTHLIEFMCIGFIALVVRRINDNLLVCMASFKKLALLQYGEALFKGSVILVIVYLYTGEYILYALLINEVIMAFVGIFLNSKFYLMSKNIRYSYSVLLKKSLPLYLETYLMYFRTQGDNWVVATYLGPAAMAVYFIAKTIYSTLFMIFQSVDKVVTQKLAEYKNNTKYIAENISRLMDIISCTMIPFILLSMAIVPSVIYVIAGLEYSEAVTPALIFCFVVIVFFIRMPVGRALFVIASPKLRLKVTFLETIIMIPLLLIMAPLYKTIGVVLSMLLAMVVGGVYTYFILKKYISFEYKIRQALNVVLLLFPPVMIIVLLQRVYINLYIIPVYILVSIFMIYLFLRYYSPLNIHKNIGELLPDRIWKKLKPLF